MIFSNDGVALFFEIIGDGLFGLVADTGSVFAVGLCLGEAGDRFARFEGFTVFWSEAAIVDGCDVGFGAVTNVSVKTVVGILFGEVDHVMIAGDLGDDGSSGNCRKFGVGFDMGRYVRFERGVFEKIDFTVNDDLGKRCVKFLN